MSILSEFLTLSLDKPITVHMGSGEKHRGLLLAFDEYFVVIAGMNKNTMISIPDVCSIDAIRRADIVAPGAPKTLTKPKAKEPKG